MARSKADRWAQVHADALAEFDEIQAAVRDERTQCVEDRRFCSISGAQWEGDVGEQFQNKARFEFNKVHLAVLRIFNEYRNNRITVDFTTKDGQPDEFAETCDGLYRADEKACQADEAYDNAFDEAAMGGMGAWRVVCNYEDDYGDEDDRQRVAMEPIFDADTSVFFNLDARRQDKSDAKRCYLLRPMTPDAYKAEWDVDPTDWPKEIQRTEFDWQTPDLVWLCELYKVEESKQMVYWFRGLVEGQPDMRVTQAEFEADPNKEGELLATGFRMVRSKRVTVRRIVKYCMDGGGVRSEDEIPGTCIPVIPAYGKRWVIDGVERCMGHTRIAKDAQRLVNLLGSWLAEMAMRFDIEKPILTPEQIKGHASMWAEDNIKRFPYLLLNATTDENGNRIPPTQLPTTKAPNLPPAIAALAQMAEQSLTDMLGNQQAGEEVKPNISGKVIELVQNRLDMQVFMYMTNFAKAMKRCGEVWLSMMKAIAVQEGRRMKTVEPDGETGSVVLNEPGYDQKKQAFVTRNDMTKANFDCDVDVGPSSSSRRASTVRALTAMKMGTTDPETVAILDSMIMMNLEGEGLGDARDYFRRKLVRMGVVKPTGEEAEEMAKEQAQAQPSPQDQALLGMAEEATANAAQARAKTVQTIADADLKRAQTAKTLADAHASQTQEVLATSEHLRDLLNPPAPSSA